jgi:kynurenine formamidase
VALSLGVEAFCHAEYKGVVRMLKNGDPRRSIVSGRPTEVGFQQVLGARLPEQMAYPGLPPRASSRFSITTLRAAGGRAEFHLGGVELAGNTGTYLDAPFHRFRDREDLGALPLERVVGLPGIIVDPDGDQRAVSFEGVEERSLRGCAVLVRTGWDARWGSEEYWSDAPFLPAAAVERLIAVGVRLVGVDFGNVDDTGDCPVRPTRACSHPASQSWRTSEAWNGSRARGSCSGRRPSASCAAQRSQCGRSRRCRERPAWGRP